MKKLTVIGIIGKTHGVSSAANPAHIATHKNPIRLPPTATAPPPPPEVFVGTVATPAAAGAPGPASADLASGCLGTVVTGFERAARAAPLATLKASGTCTF